MLPMIQGLGVPLHDPLAAAVAADPSLVECFDLPMNHVVDQRDARVSRGALILVGTHAI